MKRDYIQLLAVGIAVTLTSIFIIWLVRKNNKRIEQGELIDEDIIGVMETWDSKSNSVIEKLHPKIRQRTSDFINELNSIGIKYRVYSGYRTFEEQAELYGKGRTEQELIIAGVDKKYSKPSETKVTNAKPGSSYHNYGLAFDGVEIKDGSALWKSPNELKIVEIGKKHGFFWGGDFTSLKDTPHFEDQQFGNISTLLSLYNSNQKDSSGYLIV